MKVITNSDNFLFYKYILIISSILINNSYIWKYTDILIFIMIIINSYSIIKLMGDVINDR